ncbi:MULTISPECIES: MFS transporter [Kocuria]|uniref:MFS transporter n=1 Tax=Kocuria TaxID=57493 RepID=UPI00190F93C9|nr:MULTISPECIES: MFS transporter [Kocuria]
MSAHTSDSRPPQDGASGAAESASVAGVLVVLLSTAFVMMLNETTVAVALPAIMGEFHVSAATAQWLLTGFMLTMAVVMPTTGWMLERFSTRPVFIVAVAAFLLGTLLAALAPWFGVLLLGRLFQGAGTAVVLPLMMAVTMTLVAASGLLGLARLRNVGTPRRLPLDVVSVVLSVLAFGGLIYGLSSIGQILAGGSAAVVALSVTGVGAVALVLFALRQIRRARPGEVLSAFLTSAGLVGIALVLSLFIRAPRSGSRTEIEG